MIQESASPQHAAPPVNGRTVRNVKESTGLMTFRRDAATDENLRYLRAELAGVVPGDVPSCSMLVRRALALYRSRVEQLAKVHDLGHEMHRVREGTRLPMIHRRRDAC